jgi:hypothetical protein
MPYAQPIKHSSGILSLVRVWQYVIYCCGWGNGILTKTTARYSNSIYKLFSSLFFFCKICTHRSIYGHTINIITALMIAIFFYIFQIVITYSTYTPTFFNKPIKSCQVEYLFRLSFKVFPLIFQSLKIYLRFPR